MEAVAHATHDTRTRLIEAATDLIETASVHAVGVSAICKRAGVKKGSFYHFFDSKDELVRAIIEEAWGEFETAVLEPLGSPDSSFEAKLERLFECMYEAQLGQQERLGRAAGCLFGSLAVEAATLAPDIQNMLSRIFDDWVAHLVGAIRTAVDEGGLDADTDPEALAWFITASVQGAVLLARGRDEPAIVQIAGDEATRVLAPARGS